MPDLDLARSVDWRVMQFAKERWCTLYESDVAMQVGESVVRNREQKTKKFSWRVYEEIFLAPMVCGMFWDIVDCRLCSYLP